MQIELGRNRIDRKAEENEYTMEKKKQTKHGGNKSGIKPGNKIQMEQNPKAKYGEAKRNQTRNRWRLALDYH
jgi:hypothetical protein